MFGRRGPGRRITDTQVGVSSAQCIARLPDQQRDLRLLRLLALEDGTIALAPCQGALNSAPVSGVEKCTRGCSASVEVDRAKFGATGAALRACEQAARVIGRPVSAGQAEPRSDGA